VTGLLSHRWVPCRQSADGCGRGLNFIPSAVRALGDPRVTDQVRVWTAGPAAGTSSARRYGVKLDFEKQIGAAHGGVSVDDRKILYTVRLAVLGQ